MSFQPFSVPPSTPGGSWRSSSAMSMPAWVRVRMPPRRAVTVHLPPTRASSSAVYISSAGEVNSHLRTVLGFSQASNTRSGELTQTKIDNLFASIGFICFQEHISSIVHPINNHLHPAVANIKTRIAKCNVFPVQDASHLTVFPQDVSRPVIAMNQTGVCRCQLGSFLTE